MKLLWITFASVLLSACQSGSNGPNGNSSEGHDQKWSQPAYLCHSNGATDRCGHCLVTNSNRIASLAHEIDQLPLEGKNYWYSIWFDLPSVKRRHLLTDVEVSCLKQQFCEGNEL
jgi:hypothetical protein